SGVRRRRPDLDARRGRFRALRDHDPQHAVAAGGGDAVRIGAVGEREAAMEAAVHALDARVALGLRPGLGPAFTLDGEHALVHLDFDVLRVHAGDVRV